MIVNDSLTELFDSIVGRVLDGHLSHLDFRHTVLRGFGDTGKATEKTAQNGGRKVKRGTKKAANKTASKTEQEANRAKQKTRE